MTIDDAIWYYPTDPNMVYGPVSLRMLLSGLPTGHTHVQGLIGLSNDVSKMVPLGELIRAAAQQHAQVPQRSPRGKTLLDLSREAHPYVEEVIWWATTVGTFVITMRNLVARR